MTRTQISFSGKPEAGGISAGLKAVYSAFGWIKRHKKLRRYFILPAILSLVLLAGAVTGFYILLLPLLDRLPQSDHAVWGRILELLRPVLAAAVFSLLVLLALLAYSSLGSVIIAPFNDLLSEQVEKIRHADDFDAAFSLRRLAGDLSRVAANVARMLFSLLGVFLGLAVLNAVPVIGTWLHLGMTFLYTLFTFGFQFLEFSLERRRLNFSQKLRIAWRYRYHTLGLGLGFLILTFIPIVDFLGLNLGAIAGTNIFIDHIQPALSVRDVQDQAAG